MNKIEVSNIGRNLYDLVLENSHDYSPHYSKFEKEFLDQFNQFAGVKNDVRINVSENDGYDLVKLSLLLSDFTSVFPYDEENFFYTFDPNIKGRKIIGSENYLDAISNEIPNANLYAGYGSVSEDLIESVFESLFPLIEANKLFIRPEKIIFSADLYGDGGATVHPADPNGGSDEWRVIDTTTSQNSYPLFDRKSSVENHKMLADILVPYIRGIDMLEYSKIILDEDDLLSAFRLQTKNYLELIKKNDLYIHEFRSDIIQPKLDLINRKFTTITNNHRLKVAGATIGTAGLMLLSMTQTGITAALSQFITFGLGTVGVVKNETDYQDNIDKLKDIPEYLLWRINKG